MRKSSPLPPPLEFPNQRLCVHVLDLRWQLDHQPEQVASRRMLCRRARIPLVPECVDARLRFQWVSRKVPDQRVQVGQDVILPVIQWMRGLPWRLDLQDLHGCVDRSLAAFQGKLCLCARAVDVQDAELFLLWDRGREVVGGDHGFTSSAHIGPPRPHR